MSFDVSFFENIDYIHIYINNIFKKRDINIKAYHKYKS